MSKQRTKMKDKKLSIERQNLLNNIPKWTWGRNVKNLDSIWMIKYNKLIKYCEVHGKTPPQSDLDFGRWCDNQRRSMKNGNLSLERQNLLNQVPEWVWKKDLDIIWMMKYDKLIEYCKVYGKIPPQSNPDIGRWCNTQRDHMRNGNLSIERQNLLIKYQNGIGPGECGKGNGKRRDVVTSVELSFS